MNAIASLGGAIAVHMIPRRQTKANLAAIDSCRENLSSGCIGARNGGFAILPDIEKGFALFGIQ